MQKNIASMALNKPFGYPEQRTLELGLCTKKNNYQNFDEADSFQKDCIHTAGELLNDIPTRMFIKMKEQRNSEIRPLAIAPTPEVSSTVQQCLLSAHLFCPIVPLVSH